MKKYFKKNRRAFFHAPPDAFPDQSPDDPVIAINNISVHFGGDNVLSDFSLSVFSGERVVVSGQSGSGKSTLVRCILGFVKPQDGSLYIRGMRISRDTIWQLRREIAYVPQKPEPGPGTLAQWLARPFSFKANQGIRKNIEKIPDMAACLGLRPETLNTEASRLSGGEKQRAAIMAALLLGRRILLADEPTSAMDRTTARHVIRYLQSLPGITSLIISHDDQIIDTADRMVGIQ